MESKKSNLELIWKIGFMDIWKIGFLDICLQTANFTGGWLPVFPKNYPRYYAQFAQKQMVLFVQYPILKYLDYGHIIRAQANKPHAKLKPLFEISGAHLDN